MLYAFLVGTTIKVSRFSFLAFFSLYIAELVDSSGVLCFLNYSF